jgi:hypothetical protein
VNWVLAPLPWPGACCRYCDGGLIAARKNHQALWTSCSTGWCGRGSNSTPAAKAAMPWQRIGTAEAVPFPIHVAQQQCGSTAMRLKSNAAQEQFIDAPPAEAVPFPIHAAHEQCGSRAIHRRTSTSRYRRTATSRYRRTATSRYRSTATFQ